MTSNPITLNPSTISYRIIDLEHYVPFSVRNAITDSQNDDGVMTVTREQATGICETIERIFPDDARRLKSDIRDLNANRFLMGHPNMVQLSTRIDKTIASLGAILFFMADARHQPSLALSDAILDCANFFNDEKGFHRDEMPILFVSATMQLLPQQATPKGIRHLVMYILNDGRPTSHQNRKIRDLAFGTLDILSESNPALFGVQNYIDMQEAASNLQNSYQRMREAGMAEACGCRTMTNVAELDRRGLYGVESLNMLARFEPDVAKFREQFGTDPGLLDRLARERDITRLMSRTASSYHTENTGPSDYINATERHKEAVKTEARLTEIFMRNPNIRAHVHKKLERVMYRKLPV